MPFDKILLQKEVLVVQDPKPCSLRGVCKSKYKYIGLFVLTAAIMKSTFCDVTPCSPVEMYRRFGGSSKHETSTKPAKDS
jgi:hypothetical protein